MHIGLVGGLDRSEAQYRQLAERAGHSIEWHTGDLAGRGAGTLEALVERADLVIVVTAVNSHGAVWRARKLAKLRHKRLLLLARCSVSKFTALLAELSSPATAWKRVGG
jgi:phosphoglycerate dehydrogenase-like enzyme